MMDTFVKLFGLLCCGCCKGTKSSTSDFEAKYKSTSSKVLLKFTQSIRIGAFNIKRLSKKKFDDVTVIDTILKILQRYDMVLIQEVQDRKLEKIPEFVEKLSRYTGYHYKFIVSDYLGRKTYKEQYLYIYRSDIFEIQDSYHYDDGPEELGTDTFQREPFIILVGSNTLPIKRFAIIGAHLTPQYVEEELNELATVYKDVVRKWNVESVVIMGDFNAGGRHISKKRLAESELKRDPIFNWLIENDDTTVGKNTYTYDRIIVAGNELNKFITESQVFRFDDEFGLDDPGKVSDHYPVEFEIGVPKEEL